MPTRTSQPAGRFLAACTISRPQLTALRTGLREGMSRPAVLMKESPMVLILYMSCFDESSS
jgi:hypothetical protein